MAEVAGTYHATSFTMTNPGAAPTDLLAAGAEMTLVLRPDGTAQGTLFVPSGDEGGGDLHESLQGGWTLQGSTVTLSPDADTFLSDVSLTVAGRTLVGDETFFGTRIQVTLTRQ